VDGYRDYRGVPVVGAWRWLPEFGLGVAAEIDHAEAFAAVEMLYRIFYGLLGILGISCVALFAGALYAFAGLLEDILEHEALVRWDIAVSEWFRSHATAAGTRACVVLTELGSSVVWVIIVLAALWLMTRRDHVLFWGWVLGNAGGGLLVRVLKATVQRKRPPYAAAHLATPSFSFPSGHAMASTVCYLLLVYVLVQTLHLTIVQRAALWVAASVIVATVAFSRVYLGVHFPSDVFGGMAAGVAWVTACTTAIRLVKTGPRRASAVP
jgi:undecaprenyl-diphosphatase